MLVKNMFNNIYFLWEQKENILTLIISDFKKNYLASYLGFTWAIIGPLVMLTVLTIVFQVGFRVSVIDDLGTPFVVWLTCGMLPWLYFADGVNVGAHSVTAYAFLVRKAMFRISFLPVICLFSLAIIHLTMMVFLCILLVYNKIFPSLYWVQWFYYVALLYMFLLGFTLFSSALAVFIPDMISALGIITNIGFWATPVFWNPVMIPERFHWLLNINPVYYIVQGYRDTFFGQRWFWERPVNEHSFFFVLLISVFLLGTIAFKKLRPHFADVL